jgi:Mg-chelatase subunit ChlD
MSKLATKDTTNLPEISVNEAKEFEHMIIIDHSGSMGNPSTKFEGKNRLEEAQEFTETYARFAEQADEDGITVIPFSTHAQVFDGVKADKVHEVFTKITPGGSTNLSEALKLAFQKKFATKKPAIIFVITDGAPDSESAVFAEIKAATLKIEKDGDIGVQFIQIGDDAHATAFLRKLDDDVPGAKFDIVNTLSREEAEILTIPQILWRSIND